jgi:hypothetical protein
VATGDFKVALSVSVCYLLIPIDQMARNFMIKATKRNLPSMDFNYILDIMLFLAVVVTLFVYGLYQSPQEGNTL